MEKKAALCFFIIFVQLHLLSQLCSANRFDANNKIDLEKLDMELSPLKSTNNKDKDKGSSPPDQGKNKDKDQDKNKDKESSPPDQDKDKDKETKDQDKDKDKETKDQDKDKDKDKDKETKDQDKDKDKGPLPTDPANKGPLPTGPLPTGPLPTDPVNKGPLPTGPANKGPLPTGPLPTDPTNKGPSPPVKLHKLPEFVVMDNGLANVTLTIPEGMMAGVQYKGVENLLEPEFPDGVRGYWDQVWLANGKNNQDRLDGTNFTVIAEDENRVELSFTKIWNPKVQTSPPLNIDKRYVMLRGSPGFYTYSTVERIAGMPATTITQTRVTFKLAGKLFHYMAISDERQRYMPSPLDREPPRGAPLAYPEARLLKDPINPAMKGEVDDKFQYSKDNKDNLVHGWISDETGVGFWLITPSSEFRSGGPFKQELTSHVGPTCLTVFFSNHYSGTELSLNFTTGEIWKKVYGPVFIYLNSAPPNKNANELHSTLWTDAKRQAAVEQQSWPYSFPMSKDYPHADQRGTVKGRLQLIDKFKNPAPMNAAFGYIGLAAKGDTLSWQRECKGYQFWNQTDETGNFLLKGVRIGTYSLYATVPGFIDRYVLKPDIVITPGNVMDLGNVIHEPRRFGPTIWEIGIPDSTAAEFFIPDAPPTLINKLYLNHDRFRQYGLWERYSELYPKDDLVFNIGTSNFSKDWYYNQVTRKVNNEFRPTTWQINFDLPQVTPGNYTLRVALASANAAKLVVYANSGPPDGHYLFYVYQFGHDNAVARHAIHGLYYLYNIDIPSQSLVAGKNKILLNNRVRLTPFAGIMYDYIRLEGPPAGPPAGPPKGPPK